MNLFLQTKHIFEALCGYSPDEQRALRVFAAASSPLNSVLQAAKRKARGYKFAHFKTMAYLITGELDFSLVNKFCVPT